MQFQNYQHCHVKEVNDVNKNIEGKRYLHYVYSIPSLQHFNVDNMKDENKTNKIIKGEQCRHDVVSILFTIAILMM